MNTQEIYNRALTLTHTNAVDYDLNTQGMEDMNLVYQEIVDEIVNVTKWDYFWDKWVTDSVTWQSEYVAEKLWVEPNDLDIKKINKVFIRYTTTQDYPTQAKYQNPGTLKEHPDYYKNRQETICPFFYIQDNSFFIYPAPTEDIVDAIEIFVIHKPSALTTTTTEDEIEIPTQFHKLITSGMRTMIFNWQGKTNEAIQAQNEYDAWIKTMAAFMKQRYNQPLLKTETDLNDYR